MIQVVGGDLNTWTCNPLFSDCTSAAAAEQVVTEFIGADWLDGTGGLNFYSHETLMFVRQRLDWIFYRGSTAVSGDVAADAAGSDHLPLYFDLTP